MTGNSQLGTNVVAQTIEAYAGKSLDEAKLSQLHGEIIVLITAGYFCGAINLSIFGAPGRELVSA